MSNARSPRDVCSTTIGISGLMVLALFRLPGSIPPAASAKQRRLRGNSTKGDVAPIGYERHRRGREFATETRPGLVAGRPELLAHRGPLRRDRNRRLNEA